MKLSTWLTFLIFFAVPLQAYFVAANRPYSAEHYKLEMQIDPATESKTFEASLTIRVKAKTEISDLTLDSQEIVVHQVMEGGRKLAFDTPSSTTLRVKLNSPLGKGKVLTFRIDYRGQINDIQHGLFRVRDQDSKTRGPLLFTHFEPLDARRFFPCNDEPYDKATFELVANVPEGIDVISNGSKVAEKPTAIQIAGKKWNQVHWLQDKPQSTYAMSVAMGKFGSLSAPKSDPPIAVWVAPDKVASAQHALQSTVEAMRFMEEYTGVNFPWKKYDTIGMPTFVWGGMENVTATHMNEEAILLHDPNSALEKRRIFGLVAHELAHQWFGDSVTMKWWNDVWLNESFANHMATLAAKHVMRSEASEINLVANTWDSYFQEEDTPRSHAIVDSHLTSADDAFDSTNYVKGENVLRMLSFEIGEEKFRKTLKKYLTQFAYGNATYQDFFSIAESISGEKLDKFRDSWLLQRGYPEVVYDGDWSWENRQYTINLAQVSHQKDGAIFEFRIPVSLHRRSTPSFDKTVSVTLKTESTSADISLPAKPEWVSVNDGGVVLAKVSPKDVDEDVLGDQAEKDPDSTIRLWAALKLAEPLKVGENPGRFARKTIAGVLHDDTSYFVRIALLRALQKAKVRWLPSKIGDEIFSLAQVMQKNPKAGAKPESEGAKEFRVELINTLGKVESDEVVPFLTTLLEKPALSLDELSASAYSLAMQGSPKGIPQLKLALKKHGPRGYRFQFAVLYAFGAVADPAVVSELKEISKVANNELFARIGLAVKDNPPVRDSKEWASFLRETILQNGKFSDEVKSRLLRSVETVKLPHIQPMLESIVKESKSERLREASRKILAANFSESRMVTGEKEGK